MQYEVELEATIKMNCELVILWESWKSRLNWYPDDGLQHDS